jgi:hypothetical protein
MLERPAQESSDDSSVEQGRSRIMPSATRSMRRKTPPRRRASHSATRRGWVTVASEIRDQGDKKAIIRALCGSAGLWDWMNFQLSYKQHVQDAMAFIVSINNNRPTRRRSRDEIRMLHVKCTTIAHIDRERAKWLRVHRAFKLFNGHSGIIPPTPFPYP